MNIKNKERSIPDRSTAIVYELRCDIGKTYGTEGFREQYTYLFSTYERAWKCFKRKIGEHRADLIAKHVFANTLGATYERYRRENICGDCWEYEDDLCDNDYVYLEIIEREVM